MIYVRNLWKCFRGHDAVRGISFSVPEGSAYALIGANGTGKTTTLKILMNILEPTSGNATVLGIDSRKISPRELNRIGYVSENQQMPERLTVEEYFGYLRPFYERWDRTLESSPRAQLRLPPARRIGDLSHGMRMKMALPARCPFVPLYSSSTSPSAASILSCAMNSWMASSVKPAKPPCLFPLTS